MSTIIDFLQDLEKATMLLSNIILAVYGTVMTIKSKQWKTTARYLVKGNMMRENKSGFSVLDSSYSKEAVLAVQTRIGKLETEIVEKGE